MGNFLSNTLKQAGKLIPTSTHAILADVEDIVTHPEYLLSGPGALLLANAHRSGLLKQAITKAGLGAELTGKGTLGLLTHGKGGGGHPTPGSNRIDTTVGSQGFCWPGGLKPFPLVGTFTIAAGAQTQGTNLGDSHAATSNPTVITTNDLIPGNVEVFSLLTSLGVKMVTTLGAETIAKLLDIWMIEAINGTEIARWSLADLHAVVDHSGLLSSGGMSNQFIVQGNEFFVPFHRKYDPNVPYALNWQIGVTYTTIQAIDVTTTEAGRRP